MPEVIVIVLMAVFNAGNQSSQVAGGYLYDWLGYTAPVLISTAFTAVGWFLVPRVRIDRIEAKAQAVAVEARRASRKAHTSPGGCACGDCAPPRHGA